MYTLLVIFLYTSFLIQASALKCYACDNTRSEACGQNFKAYQYEAVTCQEYNGVSPKCGKQEQQPDQDGWVGVLRWCYLPGYLPGMNETNGCHEYFHEQNNFTALYCFCDTHYCNGAPSPFPGQGQLRHTTLYLATSALLFKRLFWF